jgi:hypothetical protein
MPNERRTVLFGTITGFDTPMVICKSNTHTLCLQGQSALPLCIHVLSSELCNHVVLRVVNNFSKGIAVSFFRTKWQYVYFREVGNCLQVHIVLQLRRPQSTCLHL